MRIQVVNDDVAPQHLQLLDCVLPPLSRGRRRRLRGAELTPGLPDREIAEVVVLELSSQPQEAAVQPSHRLGSLQRGNQRWIHLLAVSLLLLSKLSRI